MKKKLALALIGCAFWSTVFAFILRELVDTPHAGWQARAAQLSVLVFISVGAGRIYQLFSNED